jgi:menaquinone-dependent protoporphyrinogen IX oxidase
MKVAILHDSQAGNGERLAETMKEAFEGAGASVTMGHVKSVSPESVAKENPDLLIVGAAIRAFHTSTTSKQWLKRLGDALRATDNTIGHAAAFVTHGLPKDKANGWGKRFRKRLEKVRGLTEVYPEWLSGRVVEQMGPLEDGAEDAFRGHARTLMEWAGVK